MRKRGVGKVRVAPGAHCALYQRISVATGSAMHAITSSDAVLDFWFGAPQSPEHGTSATLGSARTPRSTASCARDSAPPSMRRWPARLTAGAIRGRCSRACCFSTSSRATSTAKRRDRFRRRRAGAGARPPRRRRPASISSSFRSSAGSYTCRSSTPSRWPRRTTSVELFTRLARETGVDSQLVGERHAEVIRRFGRFPHRNEILGRDVVGRGDAVPRLTRLALLKPEPAARDAARGLRRIEPRLGTHYRRGSRPPSNTVPGPAQRAPARRATIAPHERRRNHS